MRSRLAGAARLRLVGQRSNRESAGTPIREASDPRWILAVRTGEVLDGPLLTAERRRRLLRMGAMLGLTPFDANLVIAIVQDRARRGLKPDDLAGASESQLALVGRGDPARRAVARRRLTTAGVVTGLLIAELLLIAIVCM